MVKASPLEELFTRTVRNFFSAGTQLVRILPRIVPRVTHGGVRTTFTALSSLTETQLARLELISRRHGISLSEKGAVGMRGIIGELEDALAAEAPDPLITDLSLIVSIQKAERYRLVAARSARTQAAALGWPHARASMDVILEEGEETESALNGWIRELGATAGSARAGKFRFSPDAGRRSRANAPLCGD